jgi:hypothetical protein
MFNKPTSRFLFVKHKLMLSFNFRWDQIHNSHQSEFGHTSLCSLSLTLMFNKLDNDSMLLHRWCCKIPIHWPNGWINSNLHGYSGKFLNKLTRGTINSFYKHYVFTQIRRQMLKIDDYCYDQSS